MRLKENGFGLKSNGCYAVSILTKLPVAIAMTTTASKTPLIQRIGLAAYRLLERMTETAYRQHKAYLHTRYGI